MIKSKRTLAVAIMAIALMLIPLFAQASTGTNYQTQMQTILNQITALTTNMTTTITNLEAQIADKDKTIANLQTQIIALQAQISPPIVVPPVVVPPVIEPPITPPVVPPTTDGLNVKSYGAKGDGVVDDTSAIQSAINAANAQGGGNVIVPAGTYKISAGLVMKSNVTLAMDANAILKTSVTGAINLIGMTSISNAKVIGGILEGPAATAGYTENYNQGINIINSTNITIQNTEIRYFRCDGLYLGSWGLGPVNGFVLQNLNVHHCGRNGLTLISVRNGMIDGGKYHDNGGTSGGLPRSGIEFEPNSSADYLGDNITIQNTECYGNTRMGIWVCAYYDTSASKPVGITLTNNNCYGNKLYPNTSVDANLYVNGMIYKTNRFVKFNGVNITYANGAMVK